jgi:Zn-dependent protease
MDPETALHVRDGVVYIVALVLSICVHEYGHARVADLLGDPLPRAQGRVTLNPIAHMDPIGTLLLPIAAFAMAFYNPDAGARMIGWGKPVQVSLSARSMTRKISIRTADILISAAGPMMNILFAVVLSCIYLALLKFGGESTIQLATPIGYIVAMNLGLCFFNLIPLPPLDGGHIAKNLLPRSLDYVGEAMQKYGYMALFLLLMSGKLSYVMLPARYVAAWWLRTLNGLVV